MTRFWPSRIRSNKLAAFLALAVILVTGWTYALNININSNSRIEYGQGLLLTTTCDSYLTVKIVPELDSTDNLYYVKNLILGDISTKLHSKRVTLTLRNDATGENLTGNNLYFDIDSTGIVFTSPLQFTDSINYSSNSTYGANEIGISSITFLDLRKSDGLKILASDVSRVLIETSGGGGCTAPTINCATVSSTCSLTFANSFSEVGTITGQWEETCFAENEDFFYALDVTNGLYKSSRIPSYGSSLSTLSVSSIEASKFDSGNYYALGCSYDGKYLIVGGTSGKIRYSSDFGVSWNSKLISSLYASSTSTVTSAAISDDGNIVVIVQNGYANFWVNGNFWTSADSSSNGYRSLPGGNAVAISANGSRIWIGGGSSSKGLYRWSSSQFSSTSTKANVPEEWNSYDNKSNVFGQYIRSVATSADGTIVAITNYSASKLYLTQNSFSTYYEPNGIATTNQGVSITPVAVSLSRNGKVLAVAFGDKVTQSKGTTQSSNDYGLNLVSTKFSDKYMQSIDVSPEGRRIVTGGFPLTSPYSKLIILGVD